MATDSPQSEKAAENSTSMSIFGHLGELSSRLKKSLLAYIIALVAVSSVPDPLHPFGGPNSFFGYNFLLTDLIRQAEAAYAPNVIFFPSGPADPVFAFFNVSMVVALLISLPYIFYQIYGFIAPGLYMREKRIVRKYVIPFSLLLTIGGLFGLLIIFPTVMRILLLFYKPLGVASLISIDGFVNYLILIPLITGLAFTFPMFLIPLVELKILSAKQLSKSRLWVYLGVALAVSIANPDPTDISSIPIVVPILVLFEITVLVAKRIEKGRVAKNLVEQA
ncbi:MAG: twin-arginine translocase subunit TatC [Nitrososphaerales archaeon]